MTSRNDGRTNAPEAGLRTVSDVARFLAVSRSKVYLMMEQGELPYVKLGKSRRVRWSDVLKLVERNLVQEQENST